MSSVRDSRDGACFESDSSGSQEGARAAMRNNVRIGQLQAQGLGKIRGSDLRMVLHTHRLQVKCCVQESCTALHFSTESLSVTERGIGQRGETAGSKSQSHMSASGCRPLQVLLTLGKRPAHGRHRSGVVTWPRGRRDAH